MPKIIYFVTEDWFFCSHFFERALAAKNAGYEVVIVARETEHGNAIRLSGLRFIPLKIKRNGLNPLSEILSLFRIWKIYREERPALLHHIALKPIIYGSLAAKLLGIKNIVNAPVGMGFVFTSPSKLAAFLRPILQTALRFFLNPRGSKVVFENSDDLNAFVIQKSVKQTDAVLILGSGVNLDLFQVQPEPHGIPTIVLVARMLWDKGVGEFVQAARKLHLNKVKARFILVGAPDNSNPASISEAQLKAWNDEGVVEWIGHQKNIPTVLSSSHIVCLPSYREGLPKSLLEGLAAGRPIVTTDVTGCREVVRNGENGILVPSHNSSALADALLLLITTPDLRLTYGARGRERAESEFDSKIVVSATLCLYQSFN